MDNLASILKVPGLNFEVKNKILRLIGNWSASFEGKPSLSYVGVVHKTLKTEGRSSILLNLRPPYSFSSRLQFPSSWYCRCKLCHGWYSDCTWMDWLGCLSTVSNTFQLHKSKAPLSELWTGVWPAVLFKSFTPPTFRYYPGCSSLWCLPHKAH